MSILLLAGSPSATSRSSRLLQYTGEQLASLGHGIVSLQVRDLPAEALLHVDFIRSISSGNGRLNTASYF